MVTKCSNNCLTVRPVTIRQASRLQRPPPLTYTDRLLVVFWVHWGGMVHFKRMDGGCRLSLHRGGNIFIMPDSSFQVVSSWFGGRIVLYRSIPWIQGPTLEHNEAICCQACPGSNHKRDKIYFPGAWIVHLEPAEGV